jgi:pimeloyl-ACP methyl ester carboxylesterase
VPTSTIEEKLRRTHGTAYFSSRRRFDDLTVAVKRFPGSVPGPDFVLVHGIGVSSRYFHPTAVELAKHGTVWLVDLPGHGSAPDPRRDVSIDDHARALNAFVAEVGTPVLVGHSMGAQVVASLAVQFPDAVTHVVLMAPTMPSDARRSAKAVGLLGIDMSRESPAVVAITTTDVVARAGIPFTLHQLPHLLSDRIEDGLPLIQARTLVIVGERDPIVPVAWARECAELAGGTLAIVDGAHVVMHSAPVEIARLIREHSA